MIVYAYEEKLKLNMVFLNYNFRIKELQENNMYKFYPCFKNIYSIGDIIYIVLNI